MSGHDDTHQIADKWGRVKNFDFAAREEPTITWPYMLWIDPDTNTIYLRNAADDAWLILGTGDHGLLAGLVDDDHDQYLLGDGKAKNTSGGAVAANDVGYIDEAGEFKTTTTQYHDVAWCVVLVGGADDADIDIARHGHVTVKLDANCSIGDYLYTSGTATQATPQSYMRPEMFGVALTANAAGAGGTCEALLYCYTKYVPASSTAYVFYIHSAPESNFRAQINEASPVGAVVDYDNDTGEESIDVATANQLAKIRLYNETELDYRLIDSVDTVADQITLTAAAPVGWDNNEWITARSQTCVLPAPPPYAFDLDLSSADNTVVPPTARALAMNVRFRDTGGAGELVMLHPWEAYSAAKAAITYGGVANQYDTNFVPMPLIQRRFCILWSASGAATAAINLFLTGYWEAVP